MAWIISGVQPLESPLRVVPNPIFVPMDTDEIQSKLTAVFQKVFDDDRYAKLGFVRMANESEDRWVLDLAQFIETDVPIEIAGNFVAV